MGITYDGGAVQPHGSRGDTLLVRNWADDRMEGSHPCYFDNQPCSINFICLSLSPSKQLRVSIERPISIDGERQIGGLLIHIDIKYH